MRSELTDTVSALPRREWEQAIKCPNPFCGLVVKVRGEFCDRCRSQQARHLAAMRAFREKQQAAS